LTTCRAFISIVLAFFFFAHTTAAREPKLGVLPRDPEGYRVAVTPRDRRPANVHPIQLSLVPPLQLHPPSAHIAGLRLNVLYGSNQSMEGMDVGLINHVRQESRAFAVGAVNYVGGNAKAFHLGAVNIVRGSEPDLEVGVLNSANKLFGWQFGVLNRSNSFRHGIQFGLVNLTDRMDRGIQFGLINIDRSSGTWKVLPFLRYRWGEGPGKKPYTLISPL